MAFCEKGDNGQPRKMINPTLTGRADNDQSVACYFTADASSNNNKKRGKMILIAKVSQMSAAVDQSSWVIACQTINGFG